MYPIRTHLQTLLTTIGCFCFYILIYLLKMRICLFHFKIALDFIPYRTFSLQIKRCSYFISLWIIDYCYLLYYSALSPFFERFFILGGPRGTRQKKLQNWDSMSIAYK